VLQGRLFLRIITRNREAYGLKLVSLAIAFATSTLILLFSLHEFGYDRFHRHYRSIFRILKKDSREDHNGNRYSNRIPPQIVASLQSQAKDGALVVARVKGMSAITVNTDAKVIAEQKFFAADPALCDIFSFTFLNGSAAAFQSQQRTVMLSATAAREYFGTVDVQGKVIKLAAVNDTIDFLVAAVYDDFPANTHALFNAFIRFDSSAIGALGFDAEDHGIYGRALGTDLASIDQVMNAHNKAREISYQCQPISEIYFGRRVLGEDARHGDFYSIILLLCISALIFFLALTSFINLTTLTLPYRAKELAVKKLAGSDAWTLLRNFGKECFALVGISFLLGLLLLVTTASPMKDLLGIDAIRLLLNLDGMMVLIMAVLVLILGVAPLFMTLRFVRATPTRLLSAEPITFPRFKRVITFLQLGISIFLIVASMVIRRQVTYSLLKEPGRNYDQVVYLAYPPNLTDEGLRSIRENWKKTNPNVVDLIATSQLPGKIGSKELQSEFYFITVDPQFKDFFNLNMVEGQWFRANAGDSVAVVNKAGKRLLRGNLHNVIGVFEGLSDEFDLPSKPVKIKAASYRQYNFLCIRILEVDIRRTVNYLSNYFEEFFGAGKKPTVTFMDKRFEEWLTYQDRLNTLSEILAIISGILSCCAIYGLSVSMVRDKLKQIAIRKLFGASGLTITRLLIREFARQMLFAMLVFGPFTYIVLKELLRSFVYTTHFQWSDPLVPLLYCAIVITLICGFQARSLNRTDLTSALKA